MLNNGGSLAETMYGCVRSEIMVRNGVRIMTDVPRRKRILVTVADWLMRVIKRVAAKKYEQLEGGESSRSSAVWYGIAN